MYNFDLAIEIVKRLREVDIHAENKCIPIIEEVLNEESQRKTDAQSKTIERLADALESMETYIRAAASGADFLWDAINADEGEAARALLAEVRHNKE